jgi:hypothetical protein
MKTSIFIILFILSWSAWSVADELPFEVATLVQKRERAISKIDRRFSEELKALRTKYTTQGNLDAANAVARLLGELEQKTELTGSPLLGEWNFFYQGKKRRYRFSEDGSFTGQYPVSGSAFAGTWKGDGTKVFLEVKGGKGRFASVIIRESGEADFRNKGYEMVGKRTK